MNNFYLKHTSSIIEYGQERIIPKDLCLSFIESCHISNNAILGIEGYKIQSNKRKTVTPVLDEIADFSGIFDRNNINYTDLSLVGAEKFIRYMLENGISDGFCFELYHK